MINYYCVCVTKVSDTECRIEKFSTYPIDTDIQYISPERIVFANTYLANEITKSDMYKKADIGQSVCLNEDRIVLDKLYTLDGN